MHYGYNASFPGARNASDDWEVACIYWLQVQISDNDVDDLVDANSDD